LEINLDDESKIALKVLISKVVDLKTEIKQCTLNNVESTSIVPPPINSYMCSPANKRYGYNLMVCNTEDSVVEWRDLWYCAHMAQSVFII
jgi:hypothetical protein